ncbi:hypothetical protein [Pseudoramibacter faecis]|uniref:hypothetical protein n=1 Tax=Pseudoramibacter faecis TaxID=3108534 RepID=UPI002E79CA24|nr:hypothetical protein [Pseudoramibacter sp. HA2172]
MKLLKPRPILAGLAILAIGLTLAMPVFAAANTTDSAGNVFSSQLTTDVRSDLLSADADVTLTDRQVGGDFFAAGQSISADSARIGGSAFVAGSTIALTNTRIGGSLRAAGQNLSLRQLTVRRNITVGGQSIAIDRKTKTAGLYASGQRVTFSGKAQAANLAGETVTFNGQVDGDVTLDASTVIIGADAKITGTLKVTAKQRPAIPKGAAVGSMTFHKADNDRSAQQLAHAAAAKKGRSIVYWLLASALMAVLIVVFATPALDNAARLTREKKWQPIVPGLVALLLIVPAALIACLTFIGLPVAAFALLSFAALALPANAFTGAAFGRLIFPRQNHWLTAILGACALSLFEQIPVIGPVLIFASCAYLAGTVLLWLWAHRLRKQSPDAPKASSDPSDL